MNASGLQDAVETLTTEEQARYALQVFPKTLRQWTGLHRSHVADATVAAAGIEALRRLLAERPALR